MRDLRSRWNLPVLLIAISFLAGCSALQADPHFHQDENNDSLLANSPNLNFGSVVVGNSVQANEYVSNPTGSSVTITGAKASTGDFEVISPSLPVTIARGRGVTLLVRFTPSAAGKSSATLLISSSASQPTITVPVMGQAVAAGKLVASATSVSFGKVVLGKSQSQTETFTNSGSTTVTISHIAASTSDFAISGLTLPVTLKSGQSSNFSVIFAPKANGTRTGSISASATASLVAPAASFQTSAQGTQQIAQATTENETVNLEVSGTGTLTTGSDTTLGQLSATPNGLSFGSAQVNSSQSKTLTVTNGGTASIIVTQATATGSGYSLSGQTFPFTIAGNQSATFTVTFAPQATGSASGNVSILSSAANPSLSVGLIGNCSFPGRDQRKFESLSFGTVAVGATEKTSATVTNSGGSSVTLNQAVVSGTGFSMTAMGMPMTLAPNQSASISITCAPKTAGSLNGSLSIASNASNANVAVPLTATAVAPAGALTVTPSSLSFGSVQAGTSQSLPATLTNSGGSSITITQATFSGSGYSVSGLNLPATLPAGQSLPFTVAFAPQTAGNDNFNLSVISNASNPTLMVPVSGAATAAGTLNASAPSLSFGNVTVGATQNLTETLTNAGGSSVTVTQVAAGAGYSVSNLTLPLTLNAGQSTSFSVAFAPKTAGSSTVSLAISNSASSSPLSVPMSGTGVAAGALTATAVNFGNVQVGNNSTQTATLTNSGGSSVTVSQATLTGNAFTMSGLSLPMTLSAGQSFTFSVMFAPQAVGSNSGGIALVSNASGTTPSIALSGNGTAAGQFTVTPGSFSFGSVAVGASKNLSASLTASGSSVTITAASVSTSEFSITGPSLPLTIPAGGSASFTLTFSPQSSGAASATLSFASNAAASATSETLSGTGTAAVQHSVSLSWNESSSSVNGYNIYRGGTSGGPYARLDSSTDTATSYTDSSVQSGQTYFYVTTSVASDGTESTYSNQVSAVIPTP